MSQTYIKSMYFRNARVHKESSISELQSILFPGREKNLRDDSFTADDLEAAVNRFLEDLFKQGTTTLNLLFFAREFSANNFNLEPTMDIGDIIQEIASHRDDLERGINQRFHPSSGASHGSFVFLLLGFLLGFTQQVWAATEEKASNGGSAAVPLLAVAAVAAGSAFYFLKGKKAQPQALPARGKSAPTCTEAEAKRVLKLIIALSDVLKM